MSAGVDDRKERGLTVNDFTHRPKILHAGIAATNGQAHALSLYGALDTMRASRDVQVVVGGNGNRLVVKRAVFDRPTMLKRMHIETIRSTASLLLEECTAGNVKSNEAVILVKSRVEKMITAPFIYLVDSITASISRFRALYWAHTQAEGNKERWVLSNFTLSHISCSYPSLSLVNCTVTSRIRFQRLLEDSSLIEDINSSGRVILKSGFTIGDPASVNGTIMRDVAYPNPAPEVAPDSDDFDFSKGERLEHDIKRELVAAKPVQTEEKVAPLALPPASQKNVTKVPSKPRRCTCQKVTAIGVAVLATVLGCGAAAWRYCFPNQDETSGWFSSSEPTHSWCNPLFGR